MGEGMPRAWDRYLRLAVRTTGPMVQVAIFVKSDGLAASYAREGMAAARMLDWWHPDRDVPQEAHDNARIED